MYLTCEWLVEHSIWLWIRYICIGYHPIISWTRDLWQRGRVVKCTLVEVTTWIILSKFWRKPTWNVAGRMADQIAGRRSSSTLNSACIHPNSNDHNIPPAKISWTIQSLPQLIRFRAAFRNPIKRISTWDIHPTQPSTSHRHRNSLVRKRSQPKIFLSICKEIIPGW